MEFSTILFHYCVQGLCKFLSHRSRTRLIRLALARTHVPVKYSEGFNPRMSVIYCPPSPVGVSVDNDFFTAKCRSSFQAEDLLLERMNRFLPEGFTIKDLCMLSKAGEKDQAGREMIAVYEFHFLSDQAGIEEKVSALLQRKEILFSRKGKKEKNVRPSIHGVMARPGEKSFSIEARLSAGQETYLSPLDFLTLFFSADNVLSCVSITRKGFTFTGSERYV
ncbi:MAG: DUF2344 domain-containing protein [Candidatus Aureabacteria bacterium]|nr:DUF2344 domain-containing protein [Candidatus Auribacterota bacterium]